MGVGLSLGFAAAVVVERREDGGVRGPGWIEDCAHDFAALRGFGRGLEGCLRTCTGLSVRSTQYKVGDHCTVSSNRLSVMYVCISTTRNTYRLKAQSRGTPTIYPCTHSYLELLPLARETGLFGAPSRLWITGSRLPRHVDVCCAGQHRKRSRLAL